MEAVVAITTARDNGNNDCTKSPTDGIWPDLFSRNDSLSTNVSMPRTKQASKVHNDN